jgi:hypothetical protein
MFCAHGHVFGGTDGVGSRFHVLRFRARFRRFRGRRVPFSCFALLDSFSAVQSALGPVFMFARLNSFLTVERASGPVFMLCALGLFFGDAVCVGFRFHVLRIRTHFRRFRGRPVPFSCLARPNSFSVIPKASGLFFIFRVPGLTVGGTEGVGSYFQVLRARTHFRRNRGRPVLFSCFALPDSFTAIPRPSDPVFMFRVPGLIFDGTEGVDSRFHVLRAWTHFRRYRGRRLPFSYFVRPDSFSAVPTALAPIFMFCAHVHVFRGIDGVGSRFHVLRSRASFRRFRGRRVPSSCFALRDSFSAVPRASGPLFMFCAPGLVFGGTEGVGSRFYVLRPRTHFRRNRGRRIPFSCFALPDAFSAVQSASGPVFMFCAPGHIFGGTEGVSSRFHVLCARTRFRRYQRRWHPFSCFAHTYTFFVVSTASGPVFMSCAPEQVLGGFEVVGSRLHVLHSRTRFRRYRGRRVPFSCFARSNSILAIPRTSGPFFMFCAPGIIFGRTEVVRSRFHVLRSQTRFQWCGGHTLLFSCFTLLY